MKEGNKILIIRLSSLGDILLTYPLLSLLKQKIPNSNIHFVVKEQFLDAIKFNPFVDKVLVFKKNELKELKKIIKQNSYDIVIDLQNNFRSHNLYQFNLKSKIYRFKKPSVKKFLLVKFKINFLKNNPSIAIHYIRTIFPEFKEQKLELYFHIPDEKENEALQKIPSEFLNKKIVGICPGSKHFTKRYPVEKFKFLIKKFIEQDYSVFIFGGKDDEEICKELEIHSSVKNLQNNNDLIETAALMKRCSALVTNDSGLMHLASLLKIPTVAIFGSTVKEFGFYPIYEKSIIVENNNLSCRPCSHIGLSKCPKEHFKCMNEIEPDIIFNKIQELIGEKN
ncbi:MAG: lipopolysaccharide heptosyltransferase II [Ignavibacteria bacterium]|nr:lipopolysaccharide heptosyltransferase II [Ignavibacteria bacterium]